MNIDYCLKIENIKIENQSFNIECSDFYSLKRDISNGKIFVQFEENKLLKLDSGIIDFILQMNDVVASIGSGKTKTFSIAWDSYSNSINYEYEPVTDTIRIIEGHSKLFDISTKYKFFKKGVEQFSKRALKELPFYYPLLENNKVFKAMKNGELSYNMLKEVKP